MSLDGDSSNILNNPEISGILRVDQISPNFETFVNINGNYNGEKFLLTDTITEITSDTGTTVEGVLMKDFTLTTNNAAVDEDHLYLSTGDSRRWAIQLANTESGSNTGSDLLLYGFADNGTSIPNSAAIELERSTGDLKCANVIRTNGLGAYSGSIIDSDSRLRTTNSTNSTSTSTGALIASAGGLGVSQDATIGGLCNADYFRFGSSKSSAVASTVGNMYLDDGTNTETGDPAPLVYTGSSFKELAFYEEGNFTTSMTTGSGTITLVSTASNNIKWCRIGNLVSFQGMITVSSVSSPSGVINIGTLPYIQAAQSPTYIPISVYQSFVGGLSSQVLLGRIGQNGNVIRLLTSETTSTGGFANLDASNFSAADILYISGNYITQ